MLWPNSLFLLQQRCRMPLTLDQWHHHRLVDCVVRLGKAMLIERLLRGPVFYEHKSTGFGLGAVSYTHLTLPTILRV